MTAKRIFDLLLSIMGLIMLLPLFLLIALWIKLDSPGPVFFRQERVGRFGRLFRIHKFRTMRVGAEQQGPQITIGDDQRITRSGRFLRQHKLDELPQLLDVLVGDMSLVGPRPEVSLYVAEYPEKIRAVVLSVPPGITDFAAIEYRDESRILGLAADPDLAYRKQILPVKLEFYVRYVQERSLRLDLIILWKTLVCLLPLKKHGIHLTERGD